MMSTTPSGAAAESQRLELGAGVAVGGAAEQQGSPERGSEDQAARLVNLIS